MNFWWVNHNQTAKYELLGEYLWSPQKEANGRRNEFYNNMIRAQPGDYVVSYANQKICHIGRVADYAAFSSKPLEFAENNYWSNLGWLLPVVWQELKNDFIPKAHFASIKSFLPPKYSPLNLKTGAGNQKAYLSSISEELFDFIASRTNFNYSQSFAPPSENYQSQIEDKILKMIEGDQSVTTSERKQIIKSRIGQGKFRKNVIGIEPICRITGLKNHSLLIASHIKPWRHCTNTYERLDKHNGLMLSPNADILFDKGLITFQDTGSLLISEKLGQAEIKKLGIPPQPAIIKPFNSYQKIYMKFHREKIYLQI